MSEQNYAEAQRIMQICNACRYCEGFCSVFPAMTQYRFFNPANLDYLANLCHGCRACYYACQYATPHEFNVNVPKTFNELRAHSWQSYAWPAFLAGAFRRNGRLLVLLCALAIAAILTGAAVANDANTFFAASADGNFMTLVPHAVMVGVAAPVFLFALLALGISASKFWRQLDMRDAGPGANLNALKDVLNLNNLGGGGHGCNDNNTRFSMTRRYLHHATFYGFMLTFAATVSAAIYFYGFNWQAPYAYLSLPVVLGTVGGILLCIGSAGMYWMKLKTENVLASASLKGMETGFIALLFFTSFSGLALLAFRETSAMGLLLCLHLGFVLTLFLTLPYSKMVHGVYRFIALIKFHRIERAMNR
jgi:citrate/tricarballylate utilization protein